MDTTTLVLNLTAIIISFVSSVLAYLALHFAVLKRGKIKFYVCKRIDDIKLHGVARERGISSCFLFTIPVLIKNTGASSITVTDVKWKIDSPEFLKCDIFSTPDIFGIKSYSVFTPYENKAGVLQIDFKIKGYGEGNSDAYFSIVEESKTLINKSKIKVLLEFREYRIKNAKVHKVSYDISEAVRYKFLNKDIKQ